MVILHTSQVHVSGYGGVSKLCCSERSTESVSVKGFPCIGVRNLATERVKHFYVNNRGGRMASVKVTAFSGKFSCTMQTYFDLMGKCLF